MGNDDELVALLERAAGADPGPGDGGDVRRRARRHVRRRRRMAVVAVAAVLVPGLFALDRLRPDGQQKVTTAEPAGEERPLVLLFERQLADGSTLRVSTRDDPDDLQHIVVDWPGSPDAPVTLALGQGITGTVTGDEWTVNALRHCPGDDATRLRGFATAEPDIADEMELVDGLAVIVVPPTVGPDEALEAGTHHVTIQTFDAGGGLLSSVGMTADVVASDEETRADRDAEEAAAEAAEAAGDEGGGGSGGQIQVGPSTPCERTP